MQFKKEPTIKPKRKTKKEENKLSIVLSYLAAKIFSNKW